MIRGTGQLPPQYMMRGRYLIVGVVGRGGMGCVYKAFDTLMNNRLVAIKEMRQSRLSAEELKIAQRRFLQEAEIVKHLTPRPHLPTFYEAFSEMGRSYLVMDFIEGKTLLQLLKEAQDHRLPLAKVLNYAVQLCDVLSYLHQQSPPVVFRDLKPANVIIGPGETIYLIDFGIARHFKPGQLEDTESFGSFGYIAPEIFRSEQTEPRSDLFSLGATLHHCLTGQDPSKNYPTLFNFSPVRLYNLQVPESFDDLIMRLVATWQDLRPSSAKEVNDVLNLILQSGVAITVQIQLRNANEKHGGKQPYYNPRLAHEVQFRINWSRFNKLPGQLGRLWLKMLPFFAIIGSWFLYTYLPFCRFIGQQVINWIQSLLPRWEQFRQRRYNKKKSNKHPPRQPPSIFDRILGWLNVAAKVKKVFEQAPQSSSESRRGFSHLLPLLGVSFLIIIGSTVMTARQHMSPWLVVFLLTLCLLCLTFFAATKRTIDRAVQAILAVIMLASLLVCAMLLFQPDIASFICSVTVGQVIATGLVLLGLASLLHPFDQGVWLEHVIVSVGVGLCAFLQYALGTRELVWLPPSDASALSMIVILILGVAAFISLFLVAQPYSIVDRVAVALATICYIGQLIAYGNHALQPFAIYTPWSVMALNVILIGAIGLLTFLSFYFDVGGWIVIARLSLLVFMLVSATLLVFVLMHFTSFGLSPSFDFLTAKIFDPTHLSQILINSMIAVSGIVIFALLRRSSFLLVDLLVILTIALPPLLLQNTFSRGQIPSYLLLVEQFVVPVTSWCIILSLTLLVFSVACRFLSANRWTNWIASWVDRVIILLGYTLLTVSAVMCLLFLWVLGYKEEIPIRIFSQLSNKFLWLFPIGAAAIFTVAKMAVSLHRLLRFLSHPENGGDEAWLGNRHTRVKGLTFTMLDRCVMLIVAGYLALFLQAIQGKFSTISSDFGGREASYSLWLVLVGLFIAAVGVLGWLRRPFKRSERIIFFIIFLTVSGCVLIASSGLMLVILRPLFVFASLTALILLILGLLLATWVEEDVYRTRA